MNSMQAEILSSALLSELSKGARWTVRGGVTLVISVHILKLSKKGTVNYFTYDQVSSICVTVQIIQTDPDLILVLVPCLLQNIRTRQWHKA